MAALHLCQLELVIDELFKWNSGQSGVDKQNISRRFIVIIFVLGNAVWQNIGAEPFDHLTLRQSQRTTNL